MVVCTVIPCCGLFTYPSSQILVNLIILILALFGNYNNISQHYFYKWYNQIGFRCPWFEMCVNGNKNFFACFQTTLYPTRARMLCLSVLQNVSMAALWWSHTSCNKDRVCACMPRWLLGFPLHTPLDRHCNFCWHTFVKWRSQIVHWT